MSQKLKTKTIIFRVNDEDYTRLLHAAGDMTLSAYIKCGDALEHERQALQTYQRQRMEMDNLIYAQLEKRQQLEQALGNLQKIRADRKREFERDLKRD